MIRIVATDGSVLQLKYGAQYVGLSVTIDNRLHACRTHRGPNQIDKRGMLPYAALNQEIMAQSAGKVALPKLIVSHERREPFSVKLLPIERDKCSWLIRFPAGEHQHHGAADSLNRLDDNVRRLKTNQETVQIFDRVQWFARYGSSGELVEDGKRLRHWKAMRREEVGKYVLIVIEKPVFAGRACLPNR